MSPNRLYSLGTGPGPPDSILTLTPGPCDLALVHAASPCTIQPRRGPCILAMPPCDSNVVQVATGCLPAVVALPRTRDRLRVPCRPI
jgi:hypothetical protein